MKDKDILTTCHLNHQLHSKHIVDIIKDEGQGQTNGMSPQPSTTSL